MIIVVVVIRNPLKFNVYKCLKHPHLKLIANDTLKLRMIKLVSRFINFFERQTKKDQKWSFPIPMQEYMKNMNLLAQKSIMI